MWGLILSASGVIAQFRRGFSTTSALTYPFPPRTAVIGMLGAVLGANKKTEDGINLLEKLDRSVLVGVKWEQGHIATFGLNNMYGKDEKKKGIRRVLPGMPIWVGEDGGIVHLPTPSEFVLYPKYEIALISEDRELLEHIQRVLGDRRPRYAPYLGVQGALATLDVVGAVGPAERVDTDEDTDYTVPECAADVYPGNVVFTSVLPRRRDYRDPLRRVREYVRVYWPPPGRPLKIKPKGNVWVIHGRIVPAY